MYAIQFKVSGQLVYCCDAQEEAMSFAKINLNLEINCKVRLIINNQEEIDLTETFNKEFVNKLNRKILYL